ASTVFSHSRLAEERSSTRRAFSSAIAACASTAQTSVSSAFPSTPGRSLERETAPIVRLAAMSGAPSQEPGGGASAGSSAPPRRARYERLLLEEGPDELLDDPDLLAALLALRTLVVPSPALFTYVAVRHTLRAAGVDDRVLADYLAALLLEFGDHDRHVRIRRTDDE